MLPSQAGGGSQAWYFEYKYTYWETTRELMITIDRSSLYLLNIASPKFILQKIALAAVVEAAGKREYRSVPCYTQPS